MNLAKYVQYLYDENCKTLRRKTKYLIDLNKYRDNCVYGLTDLDG